MRRRIWSKLLLVFTLVFIFTLTSTAEFTCNSTTTTTCQSLIDYVTPKDTTLGDISTLFGVKDFISLLASNSLPLGTPSTKSVAANDTIRITFPCICKSGAGSGISNKSPIYKVKKDDGLDYIARNIFSALVTYQEIVAANNITNADQIDVADELFIPLPCSCDTVDGAQVIHYGHVVESGDSVSQIATKYRTTEDTLLKLNRLPDSKGLKAGSVLDVPLTACSSTIKKESLDYPLLVPMGTYTITANGCVQCDCLPSSKNLTLQCKSALSTVKIQKWQQCPSRQCYGSQKLGDTSKTSSPCNILVCAYTGYTDKTILTDLVNQSACPGNGAPPSPSGAGKNDLKQLKMWWLFNFGFVLLYI